LRMRQLSLPVSTMSQWWVRRLRSAVVILASPNTVGHSAKVRLVVNLGHRHTGFRRLDHDRNLLGIRPAPPPFRPNQDLL
jgi:hypothetical protein